MGVNLCEGECALLKAAEDCKQGAYRDYNELAAKLDTYRLRAEAAEERAEKYQRKFERSRQWERSYTALLRQHEEMRDERDKLRADIDVWRRAEQETHDAMEADELKLRAVNARLREALVQFDNCVDEFLDHITARDFLHLRGPSDDDMAWLRGFIQFCSLGEELKQARATLASTEPEKTQNCHAQKDGDCDWEDCPQLRDGEPAATGRHCPIDRECDEE